MSRKKGVGRWVLFYGLTGGILLLLFALFSPAASVLRGIGERSGQGPAILIPLSFLLLSFLFAFIKARHLARKSRWVSAYGWLMGSGALSLVLLLFYLRRMTGH
jgi:hypothetical protein